MNIVFPLFMVHLCDHLYFISSTSSLAFSLSLSSESMMQVSRASTFLVSSLILLTSSFLFWSHWFVIYLQPLPELSILGYMQPSSSKRYLSFFLPLRRFSFFFVSSFLCSYIPWPEWHGIDQFRLEAFNSGVLYSSTGIESVIWLNSSCKACFFSL